MPIIRVEMLPGRSRDQKGALEGALNEAFVRTAGGQPDGLHVIITELSFENWGAGGVLVADKQRARADDNSN